eukprot:2573209-Prymnesium_polylepis.1
MGGPAIPAGVAGAKMIQLRLGREKKAYKQAHSRHDGLGGHHLCLLGLAPRCVLSAWACLPAVPGSSLGAMVARPNLSRYALQLLRNSKTGLFLQPRSHSPTAVRALRADVCRCGCPADRQTDRPALRITSRAAHPLPRVPCPYR